jgi:excisionase family DNA binding protein
MKSAATNAQSRNSTVGARATDIRAASSREDDGYLSLKALAVYAGLSVRTLRAHLSDPIEPLTHYRPGGKILVRRTEFDAWMQQFRRTGTGTLDSIVDDLLREMT